MNIGILQPGRLGDIIICLPIAKYYADQGYDVTWPMFKSVAGMVKEVVDYIDIIPVTDNVYTTIWEAKEVLNARGIHGNNIVDIAATFPGSACTEEYVNCGDGLGPETFDAFKYRLAGVPFEEKWNLAYKRNFIAEDAVYKAVVNQTPYDIVGTKFSGGDLNVKFETKNHLVRFTDKFSLFDWRQVFEKAETIALVNSAMANFIEQINLPNKKILLNTPQRRQLAIKNKWKVLNL